jgi:hypothetical protein
MSTSVPLPDPLMDALIAVLSRRLAAAVLLLEGRADEWDGEVMGRGSGLDDDAAAAAAEEVANVSANRARAYRRAGHARTLCSASAKSTLTNFTAVAPWLRLSVLSLARMI